VLFFISVGMLFDPSILLRDWAPVIATVLIIVLGKSVAAYAIVRAFGHAHSTALTISASLAQIGEFSFILAGLGVSLALLAGAWARPDPGRRHSVDHAQPAAVRIARPDAGQPERTRPERTRPERTRPEPAKPEVTTDAADGPPREDVPVTQLKGHVVLVGHGRVGSFHQQGPAQGRDAAAGDRRRGQEHRAGGEQGLEAITGNAADPNVIQAANLSAARCLLVAIPDAFEGGQVVQQGRQINPALAIIARAHSDAEVEHLKKHGATDVIMRARDRQGDDRRHSAGGAACAARAAAFAATAGMTRHGPRHSRARAKRASPESRRRRYDAPCTFI